jgi:filamentous hemagglutinin
MRVRRNPFASGCGVGGKPHSTTAGASDASVWKEGGTSRAAMHAAGAAIVTGLAGGNAVGGAAGAAIASIAAGKLNELSGAIAGADPPGNASMNEALGNIVANAIATGAGGAVGGNAGAVAGYDVDRFNRQLHPDEKTLAKQLAAKSNGQYTEAQIEDQMRIMGVSADGTRQSGAPDTLVGQAPTDSGARWISGGTSENGQPILTQITAQPDDAMQSYIRANYNSTSPGGVPSQYTYDVPAGGGSLNVTGPFTKFDPTRLS